MIKRISVALLYILLLTGFVLRPVYGQERYASCDQCGLCITPSSAAAPVGTLGDVPENWEPCRKCLYPEAGDDPTTRETLRIPNTPDDQGLPINIPPTIAEGHYYTSLGCLSTNVGDFTDPSAVAGVMTPILNILFSLAGAVSFIYLMYGAFLILTSKSDPEQLSHGRRTILGAIIGLIFILFSVFIINFIATGVLKLPGYEP